MFFIRYWLSSRTRYPDHTQVRKEICLRDPARYSRGNYDSFPTSFINILLMNNNENCSYYHVRNNAVQWKQITMMPSPYRLNYLPAIYSWFLMNGANTTLIFPELISSLLYRWNFMIAAWGSCIGGAGRCDTRKLNKICCRTMADSSTYICHGKLAAIGFPGFHCCQWTSQSGGNTCQRS